jgi:16S rRNA (guanine527-N7)-methyltransferase
LTDVASRLEPYLRALLQENQHINLTAVRDLDAARVLHVLDSLALGALDFDPPPRRCLDLGSGNGFPGVALRALYPDAEVTLLDRTRKKLLAIARVLEGVGMAQGITTVHVDAAQAPRTHPELLRRFDLVCARAMAAPPRVAELAAPFLAPGGQLVLWLDQQTAAPATLPRLLRVAVHEYDLPAPAARHRRLAAYRLATASG